MGLLRRIGFSDEGRLISLYSLTDAAFDRFVHMDGVNDERWQLRSDSPAHDLSLVDIRIALEKNSAVKDFIPENSLQSCSMYQDDPKIRDLVALRSDAVLRLLIKNEHEFVIPLEYEATLKSKERCLSKLLKFYTAYSGAAVLFICKDKTVMNRMLDVEAEIALQFKPKVGFCLLENVLKNPSELTFIKRQGDPYMVR